MPFPHVFLLLLILSTMVQCKPSSVTPSPSLKVVKRIPLTHLPSASGMAAFEGRLFVLGDDSPFLFEIDTSANQINKWVLFGDQFPPTIPKPIKPDLEAMALALTPIGARLLLFGSGSLSPQRDSMIVINPQDPFQQQSYTLSALYHAIRDQAHLKASQWNIEGAVVLGDSLYLLNRGENLIIQLSLTALWNHLDKGGELPALQLYPVVLPKLDGMVAGFSGATLHPDQKSILFTASVEQTENWVDDGPVSGTFIGEWAINPEDLQPLHWCLPIMENGVPLPIKGESISCLEILPSGNIRLLVVTDSDGGSSELLEIHLDPKTGQELD